MFKKRYFEDNCCLESKKGDEKKKTKLCSIKTLHFFHLCFEWFWFFFYLTPNKIKLFILNSSTCSNISFLQLRVRLSQRHIDYQYYVLEIWLDTERILRGSIFTYHRCQNKVLLYIFKENIQIYKSMYR